MSLAFGSATSYSIHDNKACYPIADACDYRPTTSGRPTEKVRQQLANIARSGVLPEHESWLPFDPPVRWGAPQCVVQYFVRWLNPTNKVDIVRADPIRGKRPR
jgi:hypothetical protein